jgi:hypothetical protein
VDTFHISKSPAHVNAKTGQAAKSTELQAAGTRSGGELDNFLPATAHATLFFIRVHDFFILNRLEPDHLFA